VPGRISLATPALARAQGSWIAAMEPWHGLGYSAAGLGRYLARKARARGVLVTRPGPRAAPVAVAVVDDGVLLGGFIALLAVKPDAAGQGLGAALVGDVRRRVGRTRRWLYVSCDGNNRAALRFYNRLGFSRVGRLPDLIRSGRTEHLLRLPTGETASTGGKIPAVRKRLSYHRVGQGAR
jgi:ribosomal protein S18 acetylase RimI-like enzyme